MGRKERGLLSGSFRGGAGSPSNTMTIWLGPRSTSVPSGVFIHPAVWPQDMNRKLRPHLTQRRLGQGLPPYWHLDPSSRSTIDMGQKFGRCCDLFRPSVVYLSVCRMSSITLVHPTHAVEIFGKYFYGIWYLGHPLTSTKKIYGNRPRGTPPSGE